MKKLDFAAIQKFMKKNKDLIRSYSNVFKVEEGKLIWTNGFILIITDSYGIEDGIYTLDNIKTDVKNYPKYKEVINLTGSSFGRVYPIEYGRSVKANPKHLSTITLEGELKLDNVSNGVTLEKANMAVGLGCSLCHYWETNNMYVFSDANGTVKVYVPGLA